MKKRQTMAKQYVMYNNKIHNIVVIFEAPDKHLTKYKELTKKEPLTYLLSKSHDGNMPSAFLKKIQK